MMSGKRDEMLFELEQRLAQVGRKLSAEKGVFSHRGRFCRIRSSGKVWSKAAIIAALSQWEPIERIVTDFAVRELGASFCLVTYKLIGVDS